MPKVAKEQAEEELNQWLDHKKVFQTMRDEHKDHIDLLTEALMDGIITINLDDYKITHTLIMPPENGKLTQLVYRSRLNDNLLSTHLKGVSATDGDARLHAMAAALTDTMKGVISKLDSSTDKKIMMAIVTFFS